MHLDQAVRINALSSLMSAKKVLVGSLRVGFFLTGSDEKSELLDWSDVFETVQGLIGGVFVGRDEELGKQMGLVGDVGSGEIVIFVVFDGDVGQGFGDFGFVVDFVQEEVYLIELPLLDVEEFLVVQG